MAKVQQRHAEYFTHLAERDEPILTSSQHKPWLAHLQAELNNFRAALTFLVRERADPQGALQLTGALPWMWYFRGLFSEGRGWLQLALHLPDADKHTFGRAKALSGAARLAMYAGDPGAAVKLAQESVELWRLTVDRRGLAFALFHLGVALTMKSSLDQARLALQECLECFREINDAWGVALVMTYQGILMAFTPSSEKDARRALLEGRARFGGLGDDWGVSTSSHYLGSMALREGDYAAARAFAEETIRVARDLDDNYRISRYLHQMAEIAFAEEKYEEAVGHLKTSLELSRQQGRVGDGAQQLRLLARAERLSDRPARAVRLFAAASLLATKERTLPPDDPALNEAALDDARRVLGERRSEYEWAAGVAMSWEEAVSWVLAA